MSFMRLEDGPEELVDICFQLILAVPPQEKDKSDTKYRLRSCFATFSQVVSVSDSVPLLCHLMREASVTYRSPQMALTKVVECLKRSEKRYANSFVEVEA